MSQHRGYWFFGAVLCILLSIGVFARGPLTFEERVAAQTAIERVYYSHRIWPKENPGPQPPFEQMCPKADIEAKVTDYLKKCTALEKFWQRPITPEQLQAEMDRMAKGTQDSAMLKELFAALNNDPTLIAECLARPVLADRLIQNWYSSDTRFHAEVREKAERALKGAASEGLSAWSEGDYHKSIIRERTGREDADEAQRGQNELYLDRDEFQKAKARAPEMGRLVLRETNGAFAVVRTSGSSSTELAVESLSYGKRPFWAWWGKVSPALSASPEAPVEALYVLPAVASSHQTETTADTWSSSSLNTSVVPEARASATSIWTGTEMIIWGGAENYAYIYYNSGSKYSPSTDTWVAYSTLGGCPAGRYGHSAVWTGTEMIIWGGQNYTTSFSDGARYNPSSDKWTATSSGANCPSARSGHTAIWTGTDMIIWGGTADGTGGRYRPDTDDWVATSTGANCPAGRSGHVAVWTGSVMIIWGGSISSASTNTGGLYDPAADSWTATSTGANCPSARYRHTTVWTGTEMIVWGGYSGSSYLSDGGRYNPATDSWVATSTGTNCPSIRQYHTAVWTGTEMIVWGGGSSASPNYYNDGGRYNPSTDTWVATSTGTNCPSGRYNHTAAWTGTEMIIWGGFTGSPMSYLNTGGRYNPATDSWVATSVAANCPSAREYHTAVWTGTEMVVWGGYDLTNYLNTGGQYSPTLDAWTFTSTGTNCPSGRSYHTAVWTGTAMIVWGGYMYDTASHYYNDGGRYNPVTDTWVATSTGTNCPSVRQYHTAVWTGTEMIVWGGDTYDGSYYYFNTGGRYNPLTDTWTATSTGTNCPVGRWDHTAVWSGTEMIVWGGLYSSSSPYRTNSGGRYNPASDTWVTTSTGTNCPAARDSHTAVWTGTEMIVWGGLNSSNSPYNTCNTGGRYNPSTNAWASTSTGTGCPAQRYRHSAVWTGFDMIIWGGDICNPCATHTGGRYTPFSDTWAATSTGANCPSARVFSSNIWTGSQMIIWAGNAYLPFAMYDTGGQYFPYDCTVPSAPVIASITDNDPCAQNGIAITFTGDASASAYDLLQDSNVVVFGITSPYVFSPGDAVSHNYVVRAVNLCGPADSAGVAAADAGIPVPVITTIVDYDACLQDGVQINFTEGSGATSTDLYKDDSLAVSGYASGSIYDPGDTSSHTYVVRALSDCGYADSYGAWGIDANTLGAPTITAVNDLDPCAQSGITITFTAGSGATSHNLLKDGIVVVAGYTSGATYAPGDSSSHTYIVQAVGRTCTTNSASVAGTDAGVGTPAITSVVDRSACAATGIQVNFTAGSGASSHNLMKDGLLAVTGYTSGAAYVPGDTSSHTYIVQAVNGSCTKNSAGVAGTDAGTLGLPIISNITDSSVCAQTGLQIYYMAGTGASSHNLLKDGVVVVTGFTSGSTYVPGDGSSHTYIVQAVKGPCQANSTGVAGTDAGMAAPVITGITDVSPCAATGIQVNFPAVTGATSYNLLKDGTSVVTGYTSGATYVPGDTASHTYVVQALNGSCTTNSAGVAATDVNSALGAPVITSPQDVSSCALTGIKINFTAGSGAASHNLLKDGVVAVTGYTSGAVYIPGDSVNHQYIVQAVLGACTTNSNHITYKDSGTLGMPVITGIADNDACTQSGITVTYTAGSGATSHNLLKDGLVVVTGYASGTTYNPGDSSSHTYIVQAVGTSCTANSAGSAFTDAASCSPPPEAASGSSSSNAQTWTDKNTQAWPAVSGATSYTLYRGALADLPNLLTSATDSCMKYGGASTSAVDAAVPSAGQFYWYLVTASNANGEGPAGNATAGARIVNSSGACP